MFILGLNAFHGDSSACIMKDGEILVAIEEERIRRIKHWAGFPIEAIKYCLKDLGLSISEIDYITISRDPSINKLNKIKHALFNTISLTTIKDRFLNARKVNSIKATLANGLGVHEDVIRAEIHNIEHHRSHLASAFFASGFKESAILSIDGFGDFTSTMTSIGRNGQMEVIDSVLFPHSLGLFYTAFTQFLGFPHYGDEYKIMGLAPYGSNDFSKELDEVIKLTDNGLFELNLSYFTHHKNGVKMSWENGAPEIGSVYSHRMIEIFGIPRKANEELTQQHKNLATSIQKKTEQVILHILNHLQKSTGLTSICIAGGVAQNSVANGKILSKTKFTSIYVPPAGHDAGTCIGSAMFLYHQILKNPVKKPMASGALGSKFSDDEIEYYLNSVKANFKLLPENEVDELVVSCISDGGVVGWFQGRAEFGPRALGHRSILADPRRADAKEILNLKIKRRESFRPFAPSILKEFVSEYFIDADSVPFMEKVYPIRLEMQAKIPAVTHIDGTGRLQTVDRNTEPRYHQLISAFYEKTGVPVLLNTSFNENEPIVNSPEDAWKCFDRTKMDLLVIGNYVIDRKNY